MTEMKSNWLVISEAGDAVCGVVSSPSAEILRDLMCFISVDFIFSFGCKFCFSAFVSLSFGDSTC